MRLSWTVLSVLRASPGLPVRDRCRDLDPHLATVFSVLCAFPGFPARGAPDAPVVHWSTLTSSRARQATCPALQRLPVQIPLPMGPMQTVRPTASALERYVRATPWCQARLPARRRRWPRRHVCRQDSRHPAVGGDKARRGKLLPCQMDPGRIPWAIQLAPQHACGMTAPQASAFTKHSAAKRPCLPPQGGPTVGTVHRARLLGGLRPRQKFPSPAGGPAA